MIVGGIGSEEVEIGEKGEGRRREEKREEKPTLTNSWSWFSSLNEFV